MSYSILGTGQQQKRQAISTFDALARQEQQREHANDEIRNAERAQNAQLTGQLGGMAAGYGVDKWLASGTQTAEGALSGADMAAGMSAEIGALEAGATASEAGAISSQVIGQGLAGSTAAGAGTAAAGGAAAGGTAAAGAGAASGAASAAGTASAFGPVGWAVAAGLLAYSLFR